MSEVDHLIRAELYRAYPPAPGEPDWDQVLRRVPKPSSPERRWPVLLATAAALAVVAIGLVMLSSLGRGGPTFTDRALAAIGSERYVRALVEPEVSYREIVDLATGKERPVTQRSLYIVDSGSTKAIPSFAVWYYADGVPVGSATQGNVASEPGLASFLGGYRKALANGSAKEVGETTYRGYRAKILRFTFDYAVTVSANGLATRTPYPGGESEDVAVDRSTHRPLWVRWSWTTITGTGAGRRVGHQHDQRYRIVSIGSFATPGPHPAEVQLSVGYTRPALRSVTPSTAGKALGRRALWAGPKIGAFSFRTVRLEQLWSGRGRGPIESGFGLRLVYSASGLSLEVRQATTPQPAYGFSIPKLLPPRGTLRLICWGCGVTNLPPEDRGWSGQLQEGGLFISIKAPTRDLVLAAAQALTPMP